MHKLTLAQSPSRRSLAARTGLVSAAVLLTLAAVALGVPTSKASPRQAAMQSITITASKPAFPKQVTAGLVSVTVINDTKNELTVGFGRANAGVTKAQVQAADKAANSGSLAGFEQLTKAITFLGGPDQVVPGATESAWLDVSKPGLYGFSMGNENGSGKLTYFTVVGSATAPVLLPAAGISIQLKNFKFVGIPKQIAAGAVTLRVSNIGSQDHEMELARLDPGKTQADVLKFLESPQAQNGPAPAWVHDAGGMNTLSPHTSSELTVTLTPGYYVAICFMPDLQKKGEPHFMEGMIAHFTVTA